jgi:hypothetical protein
MLYWTTNRVRRHGLASVHNSTSFTSFSDRKLRHHDISAPFFALIVLQVTRPEHLLVGS